MLALQIDNKELEQTLLSQFKTPERIKKYIYHLIVEDFSSKNRVVEWLDDDLQKEIDDTWKKEVEKRVEAYESGKLKSISAKEVFAKYGI